MKLESGYENRKARVEMIPLIDVVFLLLVFFIYAMLSMSVHRGLKVRLPEAGKSEVDIREYMSVTVTAAGEIYVDDERVSLEGLAAKVQKIGAGGEAGRPVFINGDRGAALGKVVEVLDILRGSGISDVTIETERGKR